MFSRFLIGHIFPADHTKIFSACQFMEAVIGSVIQNSFRIPDEISSCVSVGFDHQGNLPMTGEKGIMQEQVVVGQEYAHFGVGVIPTHQFLVREFFLHDIEHGQLAVLGEGDIGAAPLGIQCRKCPFYNDEFFTSVLVFSPTADQPAADLVLEIALGVHVGPDIGFLGHKYCDTRLLGFFQFNIGTPVLSVLERDMTRTRGWCCCWL